MSDDDRFLEEDVAVSEDVQSGKKVGLLPAVMIKILKWAALGIAAVILIVTVVVITVNWLVGGKQNAVYPSVSEEYQGKPPILEYYNNIDEIRGRTSDETSYTVLVRPSLGFDPKNKSLYNELVQRTPELRHMIRSYFSSKTAFDLAPSHEEQIILELKEMINRILSQGKVKEVLFLDFNVIPL